MTETTQSDSIIVGLREGYKTVTLQQVLQDLLQNSTLTDRFKIQIKDGYLYQGSHFVSSLFAEMLVISHKFEELQVAVLELPYFEKIERVPV